MNRLGDLLHFGQLLKPEAAIAFPKLPLFLGNILKVSKSFIFLVKSFFGNFNRHLATFTGHAGCIFRKLKLAFFVKQTDSNKFNSKRGHAMNEIKHLILLSISIVQL